MLSITEFGDGVIYIGPEDPGRRYISVNKMHCSLMKQPPSG